MEVRCFLVGRTDSEIILCLVVLCFILEIISFKLCFLSLFLSFLGSNFSFTNSFARSSSVKDAVSTTSKSSTIFASLSLFNSCISPTRFPLIKKSNFVYLRPSLSWLFFVYKSLSSFLLFMNFSYYFLLLSVWASSASRSSFCSYSFLANSCCFINSGSFFTTWLSKYSASSSTVWEFLLAKLPLWTSE